ncbi:MAG: glycoside hydrolase family 44 protein, partial [Deltaproteobacteria bacterium]
MSFAGKVQFNRPWLSEFSPRRSANPGTVIGWLLLLGLTVLLSGCGGGSSGGGGGGGGTQPTVPSAPTGLAATAGNAQANLTWIASSGATSYRVKRSTTSGGPYTTVASPTTTSYTDTGLANGSTYYYVVSAVNAAGESANSTQVSATPAAPVVSVQVTIDALSNRHAISPYVYGVNFPPTQGYITDSGATLVRWGGNASTRYNWKNFDTNAAADWYFENRPFGNAGDPLNNDSLQFVTSVLGAGASPLMTIGMLPWVAKDNSSRSFSVIKYGPQCKTDPFNSDAGNGQHTDCSTNVTGNDPTDAHVPLKDSPSAGDPAGTVYRQQWAEALASAFGSAPHFYDMDNEIDIWSGTHRDIHPNPATYDELRDVYLQEARALKTWDPQAFTYGPVSCCWYYYWNTAAGASDKSVHGNIDFFPWWLNEVAWSDQIEGSRSLNVFDIHSYTENSVTGLTLAQRRALALRATRDWWDPTYTSEAWFGTTKVLSTDPEPYIPFRLPRLRALVNQIYPGTLLGSTEWNFAFAGETDFSTALADADAYGILGRERVYAAARWTAPDPTSAAYQVLKFYRNYDVLAGGFGDISVNASHTADSGLFSTYAAVDPAGSFMTLMVVNKDPQNAARVTFALNGFVPAVVTTYTLAPAANNQ